MADKSKAPPKGQAPVRKPPPEIKTIEQWATEKPHPHLSARIVAAQLHRPVNFELTLADYLAAGEAALSEPCGFGPRYDGRLLVSGGFAGVSSEVAK